jgi:hypothetical protein
VCGPAAKGAPSVHESPTESCCTLHTYLEATYHKGPLSIPSSDGQWASHREQLEASGSLDACPAAMLFATRRNASRSAIMCSRRGHHATVRRSCGAQRLPDPPVVVKGCRSPLRNPVKEGVSCEAQRARYFSQPLTQLTREGNYRGVSLISPLLSPGQDLYSIVQAAALLPPAKDGADSPLRA